MPGWGEVIALPDAERRAALQDRRGARAAARPGSTPRPRSGVAGMMQWDLVELARRPQRRVASPPSGAPTRSTCCSTSSLPEQLPLTTVFPSLVPPMGVTDESWEARGEVWRDDRVVLGGSDAGAHLDIMCHANYPTVVLGELVRERDLFTLEEGVHQMTGVPAALFGLRDRGVIAEGCARRPGGLRSRDRRPASRPRNATTCPVARCASTPARSAIEQVIVGRRDHRRARWSDRRAARYVAPIGCRHRHRHRSRERTTGNEGEHVSDARGVAFVTGASRGIGKAVAVHLARGGLRRRARRPAPSTRARSASTRRRSSSPTRRPLPGFARQHRRAGGGRGPPGDVGVPATSPTARPLGSVGDAGARALGPHRRAGQQRPLHRPRPHGPHARHAGRAARQAPRGQRDGADHPDQARAAADDRARQRHHHDRSRPVPAAATRRRPPATAAGASATACRRARCTASSAS